MSPIASSLLPLLVPLLVSAAPSFTYPSHIVGLSRDATHLALDEQTRELIAFSGNGTNLGRFALGSDLPRRQTKGSCATLSASDVQTLPGWATLKSTAQTNWGSGSYNVVTNDPDSTCAELSGHSHRSDYTECCVSMALQPGQSLQFFAGSPSAAQSCTSQTSTSSGQEVGTSGTISIAHNSGTSSSTTSTVTQESSIAVGTSLEVKVGFPDIVDITSAFTYTATFTNSLSTATTGTSSETSTDTLTQTNVAGKTCHLQFTTQTCTITGSGQIPMVATGSVPTLRSI
ncbi:hypothetical protein DFH07DRAFT_1066426 [Mycena maculata]|uniref:Uncharacterized protein n=1 Tax=Mycena maculata TaxID=230809 RepID=A0AAD7HTS3_9AGAR|nr:hypothetical protein DFH07DRAFT_1066426 [Mycena maculata]